MASSKCSCGFGRERNWLVYPINCASDGRFECGATDESFLVKWGIKLRVQRKPLAKTQIRNKQRGVRSKRSKRSSRSLLSLCLVYKLLTFILPQLVLRKYRVLKSFWKPLCCSAQSNFSKALQMKSTIAKHELLLYLQSTHLNSRSRWVGQWANKSI